jgi:hypothetical protein
MSSSTIFWILMLLWLVFGFFRYRGGVANYGLFGFDFVLFVLLVILGWHSFGAPIHMQ